MSAPAKMPAPKPPFPARAVESKPTKGRIVLVTTREKIGGENEHAAMITRVIDDDSVNVMVMPAEGMPYPIPSVRHVRNSVVGSLTWRWPPRE